MIGPVGRSTLEASRQRVEASPPLPSFETHLIKIGTSPAAARSFARLACHGARLSPSARMPILKLLTSSVTSGILALAISFAVTYGGLPRDQFQSVVCLHSRYAIQACTMQHEVNRRTRGARTKAVEIHDVLRSYFGWRAKAL